MAKKSQSEIDIKAWLVDKFDETIQAHRTAVGRMVLAIYMRQTAEEQETGYTVVNNGVGFNSMDCDFLSNMAEWFDNKGYLSEKQARHTAKGIAKYSRQLAEIKEERDSSVAQSDSVPPDATSPVPLPQATKNPVPIMEGREETTAILTELYAKVKAGRVDVSPHTYEELKKYRDTADGQIDTYDSNGWNECAELARKIKLATVRAITAANKTVQTELGFLEDAHA